MQVEVPVDGRDLFGLARQLPLVHADGETGITLADSAGRIVSANPAAERILGLPLAELLALTAWDPRWGCVNEHGVPVLPDQMPASLALATGQPQRDIILGVHRSGDSALGEHVWLTVHAQPLFRPGQPEPSSVMTTFAVIVGSHGSRLAADHSRRLYRMLAENSADVIAVLSLDGLVVWASPATRWALGIAPDDLIGSASLGLHPDDVAASLESFANVLAGRPAAAEVRRIRHADGHFVTFEATLRLVKDGYGNPTHVVTVFHDVTERLEAEKSRDEAVRRFETALRSAPIGMILADADGQVLEVNDALAAFLGYDQRDLVGRHVRTIVPAADRDLAEATWRTILDGDSVALQADQRYLRADGVVVWGRRTLALILDDDQRPLYVLAQIQDITERKQVQAQLAALAMTDPLTGLPNRLILLDRLTHALAVARRSGCRVAVLYLDLDRFKQVNDNLGHAAGDSLLRNVGERLLAAIRDEDTALRLGGDEFVLICERVTDTSAVQRLADRVKAAIAEPFYIDNQPVQISVSIGVAINDGPSAEALIQQADAAMYRAKQSGRNSINVYEEAAQADALDRLVLELDLHRALVEGELQVHYQPVVAIDSGQARGYEALVRWQHREHGLLTPDRFLPDAELSRLIVAIGNWVLEKACADAAGWPDPTLTVAVNISARHLARMDFPDTVRDILGRTGLDPHRLCLEITESSMLSASSSTVCSTGVLLDLGVSLALDDFGTGQSSISTLHRLRLDAIKIDRSFVADLPHSPTAVSLVDGLIHLGRGMGLDVVAEGIETVEQADWLRAHGCPHGQGYLYGRPQLLVLT